MMAPPSRGATTPTFKAWKTQKSDEKEEERGGCGEGLTFKRERRSRGREKRKKEKKGGRSSRDEEKEGKTEKKEKNAKQEDKKEKAPFLHTPPYSPTHSPPSSARQALPG